MPKVATEKRSEKKSGWGNGQLFGSEKNENTFQGGGFKDKEKALETLRLLEGKDVTYQYQIVNSMYNRAKVILKRTTDKEKRANLSEAIDTFENFIDDYKKNQRQKENFGYISLEVMEGCRPLAEKYGLKDFEFLEAYKEEDGDLKKLRSKKIPGKDLTWDVERNKRLKEISEKIKNELIPLYETDDPFKGLPSREHVEMIMLSYSGDQSKVKKCIPLISEKFK
ncbi:Hypothetical protein NTJ_05366 [Nesidiocoris tenuis]|uniref:Uncharacterized protein n=1 Tax=Nesidiocoris tenuis TaxID=355587 RepID=A0ABN7AQ84_9HEMI|nr:Hypothetical protein NTJ_05366 [Nesidiocoris tenuis]